MRFGGLLVLVSIPLLCILNIIGGIPLEFGFTGSVALLISTYFILSGLKRYFSASVGTAVDRGWRFIVVSGLVLSASIALYKQAFLPPEVVLPSSLENLSPGQLAASERPDATVTAIWIAFASPSARSYLAVHVFRDSGPYILLCSTDKDERDFVSVREHVADFYRGRAQGEITDRGEDICDSIEVPQNFTQKSVAAAMTSLFGPPFRDARIQVVHYERTHNGLD